MSLLPLSIIAMLGGLCAVLANKGIAVFNDGLRPVVPEYLEGKIGKKELAATSFALSFGLVIGFGIPVSIGASIILVHSIFLMTDIIGSWSPVGLRGVIIAFIAGAIYAIGIVLGLQWIIDAFALLPINFLSSLFLVGSPVIVGFVVFPTVAIAMQHGFNKGVIAMMVSVITFFLVKKYGIISINEETTLTINPEGVTLLAGVILMIIFAGKIKGSGNANETLLNLFAHRVSNIRKNWLLLIITGGLVTAATASLLISADPISLQLLSQEKFTEASLVSLARSIGFIPLVFSTAIVTGVYSPSGTTLIFALGILLRGHPIIAFLAGSVVIYLEILLLGHTAKGLDRFPGIREMGEHIRTSINKVLEITLLIGGGMACQAITPGIGYFWMTGLYLLNRTSKRPFVNLAMGPIAAITLGILVNILYVIGIYTPS
ncbi:YhfT family protein (plasmid) [Entomospira nematocerorum]|uniref:Transport system permease protein n=1 Tax=Entomospira nematocerorum TaxID=2719987 RepID=A0A968KVU3_9SPIO|nr:YhfT family protein [Entomospira nematocera]NIZ47703.1 hypothetical protein [Entomospira nematocera]WDI34678.1 YhfT family protein [Entomospira nematocera]